ncbi:hypothetical protein MSAN_02444900 [Mycena sanguinolenta]|uniref:Uncharacterized protein n=1 Tax=Mycena sanguinolenta TaxID=230812 RepID=A0A8H6WXX0_9AGAR|nr:hypothetical protein MSAN_02444900 [Mycena sanguinolenta]
MAFEIAEIVGDVAISGVPPSRASYSHRQYPSSSLRRSVRFCAVLRSQSASVVASRAEGDSARLMWQAAASDSNSRRQPASQVASGSGSDGSILARPCSAIYILCAVIVRMAMCTAFEVAEIVVDEWDIAIASSASSSRIFIIFLRSMRPSALPRKRSGCAPHTAGGASPTAIQIQRLEAQLPAMARSGNGADAAAVRLLASGSGARGLSFACRYGEYRV